MKAWAASCSGQIGSHARQASFSKPGGAQFQLRPGTIAKANITIGKQLCEYWYEV